MEGTVYVTGQKISLKKKLILAWVALIVLLIGFVAENLYCWSRYKGWQDAAILGMTTVKLATEPDFDASSFTREELCYEFSLDLSNPWGHTVTIGGTKYDTSDLWKAKNEMIDSAREFFQVSFDYPYYDVRYVFEFTTLQDYAVSRLLDYFEFPTEEYLGNLILAVFITVYFVLLLITQIIHTKNRTAGIVIDGDIVQCKKNTKKAFDISSQRITKVKKAPYKGIKIKSPGASFHITMLKNQVEIIDIITDLMNREAPPIQAPSTANPSYTQLIQLKELLDSGVISQEEFDAKKKQLLGL